MTRVSRRPILTMKPVVRGQKLSVQPCEHRCTRCNGADLMKVDSCEIGVLGDQSKLKQGFSMSRTRKVT